MSPTCQNCPEHSSVVLTNNFIERQIDDLKKELHEHKGEVKAKFDGTTNEMKELRKELTDRMNEGFKKLESKLDEKDTKAANNKTLIISTIVSPLVVGVLLILAQQFLK